MLLENCQKQIASEQILKDYNSKDRIKLLFILFMHKNLKGWENLAIS